MQIFKSFLILFFLLKLSVLPAQNQFSLNIQTGNTVIIKTGPQLYSIPNLYYFNSDVSWDKKFYPSISLGITYETPILNLFVDDFYLMTDLNLDYKNYHPNFYEAILISNNLYLPVRIKEKRFRMHLGIRNSYILADFTPDESRAFYPINRHQFGALALFNYDIQRLRIGLNIYGDIKTPIFNSFSPNGKFRTFETALRVSYQL